MSDKVLSHAAARESLTFSPAGGTPKKMDSAFFRGENCNFNPYQNDHLAEAFCKDFILKGWLPPNRFIASSDRVTAFGSCFAENITQHLIRQGFDMSKSRAPEIYLSTMGEGLVNVYSLLQQFEWALENTPPPRDLWHGFRADSFGYHEPVRQRTRDIFLGTDVFIVTFGLSEIWYDEVSGGIFWRAVPMNRYDASRHKFRVCSFDETKAAIKRIFDLIKKHVPQAKVIFTLSPIPLAATFRPQSCITANSVSKALIRAAIDEFMREVGPESGSRLFYFPAYEIVAELFPCRHGEDGRHLLPEIVPAVMKLFEAYYCQTALTAKEAEDAIRHARRQSAAAVDRVALYAAGKS